MKIAIINLLRSGDILQSLPLIKSLTIDNDITLFIQNSPIEDLLRSKFRIKIEKVDIPSIIKTSNSFSIEDLYTQLDRKLHKSFDKVYSLNSLELSYLLASYLSDDIVGVSYNHKKLLVDKQFSLLFQSGDNRESGAINLVDLYLSYIENPIYKTSSSTIDRVEKIVININTGAEIRNFPLTFYKDLINSLSSKSLTIVGTDIEKGKLLESSFPFINNLVGKIDLSQLMYHLENNDLLISPDTATVHLATFTNIEILALYNISAFYIQTSPYGKATIIIPDRDCYPCNEDYQPCGSRLCMDDYSGEEIGKIAIDFHNIKPSKRVIKTSIREGFGISYQGGEQKLINKNLLIRYLLTSNPIYLKEIDENGEVWSRIKAISSDCCIEEILMIISQDNTLNYLLKVFGSHKIATPFIS